MTNPQNDHLPRPAPRASPELSVSLSRRCCPLTTGGTASRFTSLSPAGWSTSAPTTRRVCARASCAASPSSTRCCAVEVSAAARFRTVSRTRRTFLPPPPPFPRPERKHQKKCMTFHCFHEALAPGKIPNVAVRVCMYVGVLHARQYGYALFSGHFIHQPAHCPLVKATSVFVATLSCTARVQNTQHFDCFS